MTKSSASAAPATSTDLMVPMPRVVKFVRQLSHDLRNHLNAVELQSAFLAEISEDAEVSKEVKRLREMISDLGQTLQKLTASLGQIKLAEMTYAAADLFQDLQQKFAMEFPRQTGNIEWNTTLPADAMLEIDPQLIQQALLEVLQNAFQHQRGEGKIVVSAGVEQSKFSLVITEPKTGFDRSTEDWGNQPFASVGHAHYGLGLYRARAILSAHGGELKARYDSSSLITTIVLPLTKGTA